MIPDKTIAALDAVLHSVSDADAEKALRRHPEGYRHIVSTIIDAPPGLSGKVRIVSALEIKLVSEDAIG